METSYRKIFWIIGSYICLFLLLAIPVHAQKASEADKIIVKGIRIPVYQEGRDIPILLLTGKEAKPIGVRVEMKGVKLVWYGDHMKDIRGQVETDVAVYDQSSKTVAGGDKITYKSPEIDISGVGFDIDHTKKTLHVRSNVEVVIKGDKLLTSKQRRASKGKLKGGKLSLMPTTKKGMEDSKKDPNKSNLKKLLNDINRNKKKVKDKK